MIQFYLIKEHMGSKNRMVILIELPPLLSAFKGYSLVKCRWTGLAGGGGTPGRADSPVGGKEGVANEIPLMGSAQRLAADTL